MVIEIILIILGILTSFLGLWNIIIGAYIWGFLFLVGGIWSIALGVLYILQLRKAQKNESSAIKPAEKSEIDEEAIIDNLTKEDLFNSDNNEEIDTIITVVETPSHEELPEEEITVVTPSNETSELIFDFNKDIIAEESTKNNTTINSEEETPSSDDTEVKEVNDVDSQTSESEESQKNLD